MNASPRAKFVEQGMIGACAALMMLSCASDVRAQGAFRDAALERRATVIDDRLESMVVDVIALDSEVLVYLTKYGRRREMVRGQVLAMIPRHAIRLGRPTASGELDDGMIMLSGGQRFSGRLTPDQLAHQPETLRWMHRDFGALLFDLETVSWLVQPGSTIMRGWDRRLPPTADEVRLFNGDRLQGFLAQIDQDVIIDDASSSITVQLERVSAARFANPAVAPGGLRMWLDDGSVAQLDSFEIDEAGSVHYRLEEGQSVTESWEQLVGVLFDATRLVPLSSLNPVREEPSGQRRFAEPSRMVARSTGGAAISRDRLGLHLSPPIDAFDLLIPGPLILEYDLPDGAVRFGCAAMLDIGTSPWGDCRFVVRIDGIEMYSHRLATSDPEAIVVIDTPGRRLTIEIEPGNYGPINDRVLIQRPLILVER